MIGSINSGGRNLKIFWCHLCRKEFTLPTNNNSSIICSSCNNVFCEEIEISNDNESDFNNHPSKFIPYGFSRDFEQLYNERHDDVYLRIHDVRTIPRDSTLDRILSLPENGLLENIFSYIGGPDSNRYGNPPAGRDEIEKLTTIQFTSSLGNDDPNFLQRCTVCQDEYKLSDYITNMPCGHAFHKECLVNWLLQRNSCPTCRYEVRTDDEDYERRKKSRGNRR